MPKPQWRKTPASRAERAARKQRHAERRFEVLTERVLRLDLAHAKSQDRQGVLKERFKEALTELIKPKPDAKKIHAAETLLAERIADREATITAYARAIRTASKADFPTKIRPAILLLLRENKRGAEESVTRVKGWLGIIRTNKKARGLQ